MAPQPPTRICWPCQNASGQFSQCNQRRYVLPDEAPTFTIKTDNQKSTCMPFCTCPDWTQNHLSCKHMCAIFRNSAPEYSWDSFSSLYRLHKSIFFNLTMRNQSWETIYQCPKRFRKRLYGSCSIASFVSFFCLFYSWFSSLAHCLCKSIAAFVRNLYLAKQSN